MAVAVLVSLACAIARAEDRISGTYLMHGPSFAAMVQLTQTENGQVSGVFNEVQVSPDGKIRSDQAALSGVIDAGQLTLTLSFSLKSATVGGTASSDTIELHYVSAQGQMVTWSFTRGTADEFKAYTDQLQPQARALAAAAQRRATADDISKRLREQAQEMGQTMAQASQWTDAVTPHLEKIPGVEDYYKKIANHMIALLNRERTTLDGVTRSQIAVAISQDSATGIQVDVQVNSLWDQVIWAGDSIQQSFARYPSACETRNELQPLGVAEDAITTWETTCPRMLSDRQQFASAFQNTSDRRDALKAFQGKQEQERERIVQESSHVE